MQVWYYCLYGVLCFIWGWVGVFRVLSLILALVRMLFVGGYEMHSVVLLFVWCSVFYLGLGGFFSSFSSFSHSF